MTSKTLETLKQKVQEANTEYRKEKDALQKQLLDNVFNKGLLANTVWEIEEAVRSQVVLQAALADMPEELALLKYESSIYTVDFSFGIWSDGTTIKLFIKPEGLKELPRLGIKCRPGDLTAFTEAVDYLKEQIQQYTRIVEIIEDSYEHNNHNPVL